VIFPHSINASTSLSTRNRTSPSSVWIHDGNSHMFIPLPAVQRFWFGG
jgi:hypothetical protein